jgi:hypothetical protein
MLQAGREAAGSGDEAGGDMAICGGKMDHSRSSHLIAILAVFLFLAVGIAPPAAAIEASIESGGIHVERKDATSGSTLRWEWHASSDIVFSISRSLDAAAILYSSEGTANSSTLSISADDTYLLLWENQGNDTMVLDFTIQVDAGSGPILVLISVVIVVIGTLALIFVLVTKRDMARRAKGPEPPRITAVQQGGGWPYGQPAGPAFSPYQKRPSTYPIPLISPIFAGGTYSSGGTVNCPHCDAVIPANSKFCVYCFGMMP